MPRRDWEALSRQHQDLETRSRTLQHDFQQLKDEHESVNGHETGGGGESFQILCETAVKVQTCTCVHGESARKVTLVQDGRQKHQSCSHAQRIISSSCSTLLDVHDQLTQQRDVFCARSEELQRSGTPR